MILRVFEDILHLDGDFVGVMQNKKISAIRFIMIMFDLLTLIYPHILGIS